MTTHKPLTTEEVATLQQAIKDNISGQPLHMGQDTSFVKNPDEDEVVSAIKSIPCHY